MKTITHESHTADVQILVKADTMEELFEGALDGMNRILKADIPEVNITKNEKFEIEVGAPDQTCLLIDFLSDILTESHEKRRIYSGLKILDLKTSYIKACIYGIPVESFDDDVKAVTYHMAKVEKRPDGKWQTSIVFDI
ncbi:SHS2 domain-containing protein [Daejeonella rubra]|uniref:SHS2 domain-containing protein n=1 Tax=Daejeonella rubra TaxID=990371 RepID=A0A1G9MK99_9SPHI|nr:archease [Daejeonella rubra]SDL74431.1 SHS2 domain-containing protein [Daejeonella rubra]